MLIKEPSTEKTLEKNSTKSKMVGSSKSKSLKKTNSDCRISSEQNYKMSSLSKFWKRFCQNFFSESVYQFFLDESPKCCGRHVVSMRKWMFNTHSFFIFVYNRVKCQYFSVFLWEKLFLSCQEHLSSERKLPEEHVKSLDVFLKEDKDYSEENFFLLLPGDLFYHYGFTLWIPKHKP